MAGEITRFGTAPDGRDVQRITLRSEALTIHLLTWGAVVQDVRLAGVDWPLTLGAPTLDAYLGPLAFFGAVVGPVANRIAGASAVIDGRLCRFPANEGTTLLHGGASGTQSRHWDLVEATADSATLMLRLGDGDDGFPGNRSIEARVSLEGPSLGLFLTATSDAPTLMNLANHSYWNLDGGGTVAGHRLSVDAAQYLPTQTGLPTGEIRPVSGSFDLRGGRVLDLSEGLDHNYCLASAPRALTEVARLTGQSGVSLLIATTEPGLQVYTGAMIDSEGHEGLTGTPYDAFTGVALEAQHWPDAPHHAAFPSIRLDPGQTYRQQTRLTFARQVSDPSAARNQRTIASRSEGSM